MKLSILGKAIGFTVISSFAAHSLFAQDSNMVRVIVKYKDASSLKAKPGLMAVNAQVKRVMENHSAMAVEVTKAGMKALQANPEVEYVEVDQKRYLMALTTHSGAPYETGQLVPYGIKMVQADELPQLDQNAGNRKICIIDSGVDATHEDLATNHMTGEFDEGTQWWYTDENHHGTHVAGTIAALNNAGVGVVGVNSNGNINLHIVKVFGAAGWAYSSDLVAATDKCAAAGANVISMSLGGSFPSQYENAAFKALLNNNILSVAAAGNGGTSAYSYPASYHSVMSVAAVDDTRTHASFSQFNDEVDIAGPGVNVLSSIPMGTGRGSKVATNHVAYASLPMAGSPVLTANAPLADFGIGDATSDTVNGKICLIQRGTIPFATKVTNCQLSGGVGAMIYNNVPGPLNGTLGTTVTSIPSVGLSDVDGATLKGLLGGSVAVNSYVKITSSNYAYFSGTSMATPHVSAVAALVWSYFPSCTAREIFHALDQSAKDIDVPGRDDNTGHGLVQAGAALKYLTANACGA